MSRYGIWAPWKPTSATGRATYYPGPNEPAAVVLHVAQGWLSTILGWARSGYPHASWHFTVALDGGVYQHLELSDGGFHAGITDNQAIAHPPSWKLWRGRGININRYTIGVEHEGMSGEPFTPAQAKASRDLCRWLSAELGIPLDRDHFPPHAVIDTVNRVNDFNTPALREEFYRYLFEEGDDVTRIEELELTVAILRALAAIGAGTPTPAQVALVREVVK